VQQGDMTIDSFASEFWRWPPDFRQRFMQGQHTYSIAKVSICCNQRDLRHLRDLLRSCLTMDDVGCDLPISFVSWPSQLSHMCSSDDDFTMQLAKMNFRTF